MSATSHAAERPGLAPDFSPRRFLRWLRTAIDAHARYRVNSALSPSQFQQADEELRRTRQLIRTGN
jgi:hypothetical protein